MMNIKKILLVLFLFGALKMNAQVDKKLDAWLSEHVDELGGRAVLMVYKDGKVVYSHAVNEMNFKQKTILRMVAKKQGKVPQLEDFSPTSPVQIASCSKWLSAALVMTFVDEGKLKLSDTVGTYLPVLSRHGKGNMTISDCLAHLTGIKAPSLKESLSELKHMGSMDQAVAELAKLPMEGKPGSVFHYSNAGLQIAGAVIEKITGKSFEDLFAERIAKPLEMKHTDFGKGKVALPAGGASSTAADYLNFLVMILNKGTFNNKRILSEASIQEMQVNRITADVQVMYSPEQTGNSGYGYGEWVLKTAVSSPGLFGSYPVVDLSHHYAAVLTTFYFKSEGRQERYAELKQLLDQY